MGGVQGAITAQPTTQPTTMGPTTTGNIAGPLGTPVQPGAGQTVIGGGIAGVASKLEEDGIKVYKEQTSYNKWEFVYDITKDPARTGVNGMPGPGGQTNNGMQNPGGSPLSPGGLNAGTAPAGGFTLGTNTSPGGTTPPPPASPQQP